MQSTLRWIIAATIFLAVIIGVEQWLGWESILLDWQQVSLGSILILTLLTLLSYLLRAERVYRYFGQQQEHHRSSYIRISFIHNALNNFLPMRLGEAAFPLLMKREFKESMLTTSAGLIWIRLMDLHLLLLLGAVAFIGFYPTLGAISVSGLVIIPSIFLLGMVDLKSVLPKKLVTKVDHYRHLLPESRTLLINTYLITAQIWLIKLAALAVLLMAFLDIDYYGATLAVIAGDLSSVLPIHGLAGSGTYEAALVGALYPLGISLEAATKAAINVHIYLLGVSALSIPLALLIPKKR